MKKRRSSYLGLLASPTCQAFSVTYLDSYLLSLLIFSHARVTGLSQFAQNCPGFKTKVLTSQEFSLGPRQICSSLELKMGSLKKNDGVSAVPGQQDYVSRNFYPILFPLFFLTFILLAILLGKHQPGVDKPDPKTWKANFRCAMNSLPDIEEVKDKSIKKGNNAFRVYRMLPLSERPSKKGRYLLTRIMAM